MPARKHVMRRLEWEPLIDPAIWIALTVAAAALLALYAVRRPTGLSRPRWGTVVLLMSLAVALVLVLLLNPTWVEPLPPPEGNPQLMVLIDTSASMRTADVGEGKTRLQAAREVVERLTPAVESRFDVRFASFSASSRGTSLPALESLEPDGPMTDLAGAVADAVAHQQEGGQAVLLLSDGIHNAGDPGHVIRAATLARALDTPIYTVTLGSEMDSHDLAVDFESPQQMAFVRQSTPLAVQVRRVGLSIPAASLALLCDGETVERRQASFSADGRAEVRFMVEHDDVGLFRYEVELAAAPGELTRLNNRAISVLRVVDEPVRVLLAEGNPYWDSKFLTRVLAIDPAVEVDSYVRMTEQRVMKRTFRRERAVDPPAEGAADAVATADVIPISESWEVLTSPAEVLSSPERLAGYQVVVLGRDADEFLTEDALETLRQWIAREGGSLICYRGQPTAQPGGRLAPLLPVRWTPSHESRFHVDWTDRGRQLHWLATLDEMQMGRPLSQLPTLASAGSATASGPLTVVLASAQGDEAAPPAVSYQPYGGGRVVVIEGAGMWRWAFLPPRHQQYDDVYRSLWQSVVRWLVSSAGLLPGQNVGLRTDKVVFTAAELPVGTLLLREPLEDAPPPTVTLSGANLAEPRKIVPVPLAGEEGAFRVLFGKLDAGHYEAVVDAAEGSSGASTAFDVREFTDEQLDLQARTDVMARLASLTDGGVLDPARPDDLLREFEAHQRRSRPPEVRRYAAWDRWWLLIGTFGLWMVAWGVRRSSGLV